MTLTINLAGTNYIHRADLGLYVIDPNQKPALSNTFPYLLDDGEVVREERFRILQNNIGKASVILETQVIRHTRPGTFSSCGDISLNVGLTAEPTIRLMHSPNCAFYSDKSISPIPIWHLSIEDIPSNYPKDEVARKVKMLLPEMMVFLSRIVYDRVFVVFRE
jgi:hypothetical protein